MSLNPKIRANGTKVSAKETCVFKRILEILPAICLATSMAWAAGSPFIGVWKLDPSKSRMPDEMKVQRTGSNTYAFDFGGGAVLRPRVGEWTSAHC